MKNKKNGYSGHTFIEDTKNIKLLSKKETCSEALSMVVQIVIYSLIFLGIDVVISGVLKLLY